jgi:hypothetical protein
MTEGVAINAHWSRFGLSLVTDVGVRVARPLRFGDVTFGTHAFWGLGIDYAPFSNDILHLTIESLVRPQLVNAWTLPKPNKGDSAPPPSPADWVMPAEWLISVSSKPADPEFWFSLGAGMAMPLSHRAYSDARMDSWFIAPSTPRYQLVASLAARN